jgi:hypothetical protein
VYTSRGICSVPGSATWFFRDCVLEWWYKSIYWRGTELLRWNNRVGRFWRQTCQLEWWYHYWGEKILRWNISPRYLFTSISRFVVKFNQI